MRIKAGAGRSGGIAATAAALALSFLPATAPAQDAPLSAIDWLSQSVAAPPPPPPPPVAKEGVIPEDVAVSTLGATTIDSVGLLPPAVTGLPMTLWGTGRTADIVTRIAGEGTDSLPALRGLMMTILLAEARAPADAGKGGELLRARIDRLLDLGALDQARALLDVADASKDPELFRRSFDVDLLTGSEDEGCAQMVRAPGLAPTFPARIFCLARSGDWNAAALTLRTAQSLGFVTEEEDALLSRFLDPDLYEGEPPLPAPERTTPLTWRMFEAIGEPLPTATLPLAFAHAELRPSAGWKSQIEAAERLTRAGAVTPNQLLGLYTERKPAASGGVWDRVAAFQRFEAAFRSGDSDAIARIVPEIWQAMTEAELEVAFAELYGEELHRLNLSGEAGQIAFVAGLLSPSYERVAATRTPADAREGFLIGLAKGNVTGLSATDSMGRVIAPAFKGAAPSDELRQMLDEGRMGEAILSAIEKIERGVQGEVKDVTDGLALFRAVGLEGTARRTALELMLLERRG